MTDWDSLGWADAADPEQIHNLPGLNLGGQFFPGSLVAFLDADDEAVAVGTDDALPAMIAEAQAITLGDLLAQRILDADLLAPTNLDDLVDVVAPTPADGQVLGWDADGGPESEGAWVPTGFPDPPESNVPDPTDDDQTVISVSGEWTAADPATARTALDVPSVADHADHHARHELGGDDEITLDASQVGTGTVAPARLGSGSGGSTKFLREDSTWQTVATARPPAATPLVVTPGVDPDGGATDAEGFTLSGVGYGGATIVSYSVVQASSFGTVNGTAPNLDYTSDAGDLRADFLLYTVTDSNGLVSEPAPVVFAKHVTSWVTAGYLAEQAIVRVAAGDDLTTARPDGAETVYWEFDDPAVDPGASGENIVNGETGDMWFVPDA